jgi:hypothetical protein
MSEGHNKEQATEFVEQVTAPNTGAALFHLKKTFF